LRIAHWFVCSCWHFVSVADGFRLCAALGFLIADMGSNRVQVRDIVSSWGHGLAVLIGGIFAMLACVLSYIQIRSHKRNWTHPPSQKHVVRILYMVPIYAVSALGSLTFMSLSTYIDFVRGVYEAYVIYTFMILLTKYLGGHNGQRNNNKT
jgi:heme/copper-type cytochrome/quinol oxidase subunit 2